MSWLLNNGPVWAPDGDGGAPPVDAADPSATLYPDEAKTAVDVDAEKSSSASESASSEWKPYEDDPAKSKDENDAARAENDAANPINQVPEDGVYKLEMPEGVEADQGLIDALSPVFKDAGLTTAQAQALSDKFAETMQARAADATKNWGDRVAGWADEAKKDPEIGGAKWADTERNAMSAVRRFGTPALGEYLEASGAGNHPEMIRLMAKVGAMIAEDDPAISDQPGAKPADRASVLYPDDQPKGN